MKKKSLFRILLIASLVLLITGGFVMAAGGDSPVDEVVDGIVGILLYPLRLIPLIIGFAAQLLGTAIMGGGDWINLKKVLFNNTAGTIGSDTNQGIDIISIDFFGLGSGGTGPYAPIQNNVAIWYVAIRNLAAVILIIIAVYVGIKMATATVATEQAKYKAMLYDWLKSLGLLFAMHFIMLAVIFVNDQLVQALGAAANGGDKDPSDFVEASLLTISFTKGMAMAICYLMMSFVAFTYLLAYIKRMITIAFLIIIAPLVTVTYSIDKMGDSKSQAFNTWFKEFTYNILIQPFHCVVYLSLINISFDILDGMGPLGGTDVSIGGAVVAIMFMGFLHEAEKIIKTIFGFQSRSMSDALSQAATFTALAGMAKSASKDKKDGGEGGGNKYSGDSGKSGDNSSASKAPKTKDVPVNDQQTSSSGSGSSSSGGSGSNSGSGSSSGSRRSSGSSSRSSEPRKDRRSEENRYAANDRVAKQKRKDDNRSRLRNRAGKRVLSGYGNIAKFMVGATTKASLIAGGYAMGGNLSAGMGMAANFSGLQKKGMAKLDGMTDRISISSKQRGLARAYHDYQDITGKSDAEVSAHAIKLSEMSHDEFEQGYQAGTYEDKDAVLRNRMVDLGMHYRSKGLSGEKVSKLMEMNVDDVATGKRSEFTGPQRLFGKDINAQIQKQKARADRKAGIKPGRTNTGSTAGSNTGSGHSANT